MIGLGEFAFKGVLTNIFTYVIAQIQIVITYIFVKYEVDRLQNEINLEIKYRFSLYIVTLVGIVLTVLSCFYFPDAATLIVLMILPISVYELFDLAFKKVAAIFVSLVIAVIAFGFLFASIYPFVQTPNQLTLLNIFFGLVTIIDFIFNYCLKDKVKTIE